MEEQTIYDVEFENGVGKLTMAIEKQHRYDVVLQVSDGKNIRNIILADNLHPNEMS